MAEACAKFGRKRTYSFGLDVPDGQESAEPSLKGETPHSTLKPYCLTNDIKVRPEESYTLMTINEIMNGSVSLYFAFFLVSLNHKYGKHWIQKYEYTK